MNTENADGHETLAKTEIALCHFERHFQSLPHPAYIFRRVAPNDYELVGYNRAAGALPFSRVAEKVGCHAKELFGDRTDIVAGFEACMTTDRAATRESELRFSTGVVRDVRVTAIPLPPDLLVHARRGRHASKPDGGASAAVA